MRSRTIASQTLQSLCLVGVVAFADSSMAAEHLTIGQLHKYHASYHMHSVTIVGKVEEMQASPPLQLKIRKEPATLQLSLWRGFVCPGR